MNQNKNTKKKKPTWHALFYCHFSYNNKRKIKIKIILRSNRRHLIEHLPLLFTSIGLNPFVTCTNAAIIHTVVSSQMAKLLDIDLEVSACAAVAGVFVVFTVAAVDFLAFFVVVVLVVDSHALWRVAVLTHFSISALFWIAD